MVTWPIGRSAAHAFAAGLGILVACVPGSIACATQSRLVNCGGETCLRLAGQRANAAVEVRTGGGRLAVEGGRSWHATVKLDIARDWRRLPDGTLSLDLYDPSTGIAMMDAVMVPPGALSKRVELASLIVRAH
jgi:hypothetical protein